MYAREFADEGGNRRQKANSSSSRLLSASKLVYRQLGSLSWSILWLSPLKAKEALEQLSWNVTLQHFEGQYSSFLRRPPAEDGPKHSIWGGPKLRAYNAIELCPHASGGRVVSTCLKVSGRLAVFSRF